MHRTTSRLAEDLSTVAEFEVPIGIASLGVRADVNGAVRPAAAVVERLAREYAEAKKRFHEGVIEL
ncbi:hypothetical protein ABZ923_12035 [Streptomyces sp. NPDC046881]|uniref:hypothetical protein n=1 Tax=Streptomyces sp. NPDC046881 TaxID=3155374 RepID=UPI0033EDA686